MLGLTDRLEPWARRFQRAPAAAPRPAAVPGVAPASSPDATEPTSGEGTPRRRRRFARRALQQR